MTNGRTNPFAAAGQEPLKRLTIPTGQDDPEAIRKAIATANEAVKAKTGVEPTKVIAHAYALIPVEGQVDQFRAVHLENVAAQKVTALEPNGRPERARRGIERIAHAITMRWRKHTWA